MSVPEVRRGKASFGVPRDQDRAARGNANNLKGPGRIELNASRIQWSFHVSAEQLQTLPLVQHLGLNRLRPPGSVFPKEEYVSFQATTYDGEVWISKMTQDPHIGGPVGGPGMVSGHAFILETTKQVEATNNEFVRFYLPGEVKFPALFMTRTERSRVSRGETRRLLSGARDWAEFSVDEEWCTLSLIGSHTEIVCELMPGGVAAQRHRRMQEALTFALGQVLHPCAMEVMTGGTQTTILYEWSSLSKHARPQDPPLHFGTSLPLVEVYDIAEAYYQKVSAWTSEEASPLAYGVFSVMQAAQHNIELHVIQLVIAAEALIKNAGFDIVPIDPGFQSEVEELRQQIRGIKLSERLRQKIESAFDRMLKTNPLQEFIRQRGLPDKVYTSWKKLRHPHAHGDPVQLDDGETLWKRRSDVLQLCYSIVFAFIGYEGT